MHSSPNWLDIAKFLLSYFLESALKSNLILHTRVAFKLELLKLNKVYIFHKTATVNNIDKYKTTNNNFVDNSW